MHLYQYVHMHTAICTYIHTYESYDNERLHKRIEFRGYKRFILFKSAENISNMARDYFHFEELYVVHLNLCRIRDSSQCQESETESA